MIKIKTKVYRSEIHGNGLFADQDIPKGSVIWEFSSPDTILPIESVSDFQKHFGYINPQNTGFLVVCGDDAKFMNFSLTPNCVMACEPTKLSEAPLIASCGIVKGQELTVGMETDADASRKLSQ